MKSTTRIKRKVLIAGAGIAGPVLAYWLARAGDRVTIVERAPALRLGGQNIDLSDAAIDVVKLMGIEPKIREHNTTECGLQFIDLEEKVAASFPKGSETSFTREYEILRGDLSQILFDLIQHDVEVRFGETIEEIEDRPDEAFVTFHSRRSESFDLVIAADGVGSKTRALMSEESEVYKYLGVYTSYLTLPRHEHDSKFARWYNAPGGKVLLVRPDNKGTTRVSVNYWQDTSNQNHFSREETLLTLSQVLAGVGWEGPRVLRELESDPDIYLGPVSQVRLKAWSRGRTALVGDAAYCPTPFTGMGTSLAVIGAYVLAGELTHKTDHADAFETYETKFRPFVEDVQRVFPKQFRLAYPQSRLGIKLLNSAAGLVASPLAQRLIGRLAAKDSDQVRKFQLPVY